MSQKKTYSRKSTGKWMARAVRWLKLSTGGRGEYMASFRKPEKLREALHADDILFSR